MTMSAVSNSGNSLWTQFDRPHHCMIRLEHLLVNLRLCFRDLENQHLRPILGAENTKNRIIILLSGEICAILVQMELDQELYGKEAQFTPFEADLLRTAAKLVLAELEVSPFFKPLV